MRLFQREVARQLQVERDLGPAVHDKHVDVVHLAHTPDVEGGRLRALADPGGLARLDVDDNVAARQGRLHRCLDSVGGRVPLADAGARRNTDHDVCELAPAGLAHAQPLQVDSRLDARDRRACGCFRLDGDAVHQDVDVRPHEPHRRGEDERRHEQRCDRVAVRVSGAHNEQADEHGGRAEQIAEEVESVRLERGAAERLRSPPRDDRSARVDPDDDDDHEQRVPRRVDLLLGRAGEALDRTHRDEEAQEHEDRSLGERREMLRLAVAVPVRFVRRT